MAPKSSLATVASLDRAFLKKQHVMAAIDVGTNSIHTLIVKIDPSIPSFSIVATDKATARLGETDPATGKLTDVAMQRGVEALERAKLLAESYGAEAIVAAATSAVREAANGHVFLERVDRDLGIAIDLISGQEEARRIYLGVLSAVAFHERPHVIIDIGGGSTEFIVGTGQEAHFLRSIKVGAVRLTREFLNSREPRRQDIERLRAYVRGMLERSLDEIRDILHELAPGEPVRIIGTSGTIEALAQVYAHMHGESPGTLHGYSFPPESLPDILEHLQALSTSERGKLPGLNARRAEIVVAGAVVLTEALQMLGAQTISVCGRALREGLIVDWMLAHNLIEDRLRFQQRVRQRHVYHLAKKYRVDLPHAERVADLTLSLFDQTQGHLHHWGEPERELLQAAALLHSCGHFVNHSAYHKHTYYLVRNGGMLGFTEEEIEAIANLARYHRKSPPKSKHEGYQNLASDRDREMVADLSTLLRIATAIHRRPSPAISSVHVNVDRDRRSALLTLTPARIRDDCSLELSELDYKKAAFEGRFKVHLCAELASKKNGQ